ncbi:MAG: hypothetical protein M3Y49_13000, partial [Actinomycetota bacterium]|nr:hypothetical protein [Actinomycetota bacterium]
MVTLTNDAEAPTDLTLATSDDLGSLLRAVALELSRRRDPAAQAALSHGIVEVGSAIGRSWAWQPLPAQQRWVGDGVGTGWSAERQAATGEPTGRQPRPTYERE